MKKISGLMVLLGVAAACNNQTDVNSSIKRCNFGEDEGRCAYSKPKKVDFEKIYFHEKEITIFIDEKSETDLKLSYQIDKNGPQPELYVFSRSRSDEVTEIILSDVNPDLQADLAAQAFGPELDGPKFLTIDEIKTQSHVLIQYLQVFDAETGTQTIAKGSLKAIKIISTGDELFNKYTALDGVKIPRGLDLKIQYRNSELDVILYYNDKNADNSLGINSIKFEYVGGTRCGFNKTFAENIDSTVLATKNSIFNFQVHIYLPIACPKMDENPDKIVELIPIPENSKDDGMSLDSSPR